MKEIQTYKLVITFAKTLDVFGAAGGDRTHDPWLRRPILYPLSYSRVEECRGIKAIESKILTCNADIALSAKNLANTQI